MKRLLDIRPPPGKPEIFTNDWRKAEHFFERWEFNGFEMYPV